MYGVMGSIYGALQIIGGPLMGSLSDRYPRRNLLLLSMLAASISYGMSGVATTLSLLILSRVPVGLFKQTVTISQAMISDYTSEEQRGKWLGYLSSVIDFGFIIGPTLTSVIIFTYNHQYVCLLSSFIFLFEIILILLFLPSNHNRTSKETKLTHFSPFPSPIRTPQPESPPSSSLFNCSMSCGSGVVWWLSIYFLYLISQMTTTLFFPQYVQTRYSLPVESAALLQSYLSALSMVSQSIGFSLFTTRYSEANLISTFSLVFSASLASLAIAGDLFSLTLCLIPFSISNSFLSTSIITRITKLDSQSVGRMLGLASVMEGLSRTICPLTSGLLSHYWSVASPSLFGSLIMFCVFIITIPQFGREREPVENI
jgi:MFS transporter, DHA1 family, tetracycline resistance protein